jgi:uncharacterized protein (DUF433 family)
LFLRYNNKKGVKMLKRIVSDPKICGGFACIKGTRIPVYVILDFLAGGNSIDEVLKEFPQLTKEDILEAIEYGALLAREELQEIESK